MLLGETNHCGIQTLELAKLKISESSLLLESPWRVFFLDSLVDMEKPIVTDALIFFVN